MSRSRASFDLNRTAFSRRRMLTGAAALAGGGLLMGCAPGGGNSSDEISYWHLMTGGDGIVMAGLVDAINTLDAGFRATQTVLAWGPPYYTKLAMASAGGRAPDVAIMHASRIAGYAPGGLLEPFGSAAPAATSTTTSRRTCRTSTSATGTPQPDSRASSSG
jgi:ABC-type glycerol-3-phosphate transport system substrate-binding protein